MNNKGQYRLDAQMLSDLWIFRSAAETASITEGASRLGVTQGAVSQRVLRLERRLGAPLFSRAGGRLTLTEAGQALLDAMNDVSATLTGVLTRFDRVQRLTLVVSCLPSLATEWLVPRLGTFYDLYPEIELFIRAETVMPSIQFCQQEGVDVLIGYQQSGCAELHSIAALQEYIFPVCSRTYRQSIEDSSGPTKITRLHDNVPWVGSPVDFEWHAWVTATVGWQFGVIAERRFNLAHLAYHAALCGQGVAIGRSVLVNRLMSRGDLVAASDYPPVEGASYQVFAHRLGDARSTVRKFTSWLIDSMSISQRETLQMMSHSYSPFV